MKTKILVSLLAIAAVAGCSIPGVPGITTGTNLVGGNGLEITSFTAEPNAVYSGSTVRILMELQNLGGTSVSASGQSFAYLTGSDVASPLTGTDTSFWHSSASTACIGLPQMKAADVVRGTSGDIKQETWSLIAPVITAGQTRNDIFIGRVYTNYSTAVNGNVWIYTEAEAQAARASGRTLNKASFTSTSGPVSLGVSVSPDPVILYTGGDNSFSLNIRITNSASGTIYNKALTCSAMTLTVDDLNKVNVKVSAPGLTVSTDCTSTLGTAQELVAGKPATIICTVTAPSSVTTFQSFPITVTASYGYFTEKTASVTVQGR
jgi:hypothetical protein